MTGHVSRKFPRRNCQILALSQDLDEFLGGSFTSSLLYYIYTQSHSHEHRCFCFNLTFYCCIPSGRLLTYCIPLL